MTFGQRWGGELSLRFLALSTKGYQELMKLSTLKMTGRKIV